MKVAFAEMKIKVAEMGADDSETREMAVVAFRLCRRLIFFQPVNCFAFHKYENQYKLEIEMCALYSTNAKINLIVLVYIKFETQIHFKCQ